MNTIFSWIYKIYLRISAIIRAAYVAKQIKCFTPPHYFGKGIHKC